MVLNSSTKNRKYFQRAAMSSISLGFVKTAIEINWLVQISHRLSLLGNLKLCG
jgi:hypothetical protein